MSSPALEKFADRLGEVENLLGLCSPDDADVAVLKANAGRDNTLLRASLVLLCSHIEGYVEDLVTDIISAYDLLTLEITDLPIPIRVRQVLGADGRWHTTDAAKRFQYVEESVKHPLLHDSGRKGAGCLDAALHTDGFANPGTGEIEAIFRGVGIEEVWKRFKDIEPDVTIRDSVDAVVNRRNQIAHGKKDAVVTKADVELYALRMQRLAEVLERIAGDDLNMRLKRVDCWSEIRTQ